MGWLTWACGGDASGKRKWGLIGAWADNNGGLRVWVWCLQCNQGLQVDLFKIEDLGIL